MRTGAPGSAWASRRTVGPEVTVAPATREVVVEEGLDKALAAIIAATPVAAVFSEVGPEVEVGQSVGNDVTEAADELSCE